MMTTTFKQVLYWWCNGHKTGSVPVDRVMLLRKDVLWRRHWGPCEHMDFRGIRVKGVKPQLVSFCLCRWCKSPDIREEKNQEIKRKLPKEKKEEMGYTFMSEMRQWQSIIKGRWIEEVNGLQLTTDSKSLLFLKTVSKTKGKAEGSVDTGHHAG